MDEFLTARSPSFAALMLSAVVSVSDSTAAAEGHRDLPEVVPGRLDSGGIRLATGATAFFGAHHHYAASPDGRWVLAGDPSLDSPDTILLNENGDGPGNFFVQDFNPRGVTWDPLQDDFVIVGHNPSTGKFNVRRLDPTEGVVTEAVELTIPGDAELTEFTTGATKDDIIVSYTIDLESYIEHALTGAKLSTDRGARLAHDSGSGNFMAVTAVPDGVAWYTINPSVGAISATGTIAPLPGKSPTIDLSNVAVDPGSGRALFAWAEGSFFGPTWRATVVELDTASYRTVELGRDSDRQRVAPLVAVTPGLGEVFMVTQTSLGAGRLLAYDVQLDGKVLARTIFDRRAEFLIGQIGVIAHLKSDVEGPVILDTTGALSGGPSAQKVILPRHQVPRVTETDGYWLTSSAGQVHSFGSVPTFLFPDRPPGTIVDIAATSGGDGYWQVNETGTVVGVGSASWFGNADTLKLAPGELVVAMSSTPTNNGYWLFTNRGRVQAFGGAEFLGDVAHLELNGEVLDGVATSDGRGYYMVGSDGGVFSFDAPFRGSVPGALPAGVAMAAPANGMVPYGNGYLVVAGDGGVFNFSDRPFSGSLGALDLEDPTVAIAAA